MAGYADIEKIEKLLVRGIDECGDARTAVDGKDQFKFIEAK